ncbi:Leucine-rich repeat (LRR) protein [Algoriphagus sp. 4150]|uniref:leucine-rich repeat domain-containing protein n=1 Tax=Algoriphagus sp. 4150 TaxID=2817756 RepID=UPI0028657F47|nr:hypothetical protein [Algoriphagus sp. 4150]MDR7130995.1 Leucine-rich repeat (LRR) protein [Algoriphagus sp. 4150]
MLLSKRRKSIPLFLVLTFLIPMGSSRVFALPAEASTPDFHTTVPAFSTAESFIAETVVMEEEEVDQQHNPLSAASKETQNVGGDGDQEELEELTGRLIKELEERLGVDAKIRPSEHSKKQSPAAKSTTEFSTNSTALPSQAEYNALIAIYQATGGANWTNKAGWSTANPNVVQSVHGWTGVTVDFDGHVTGINLNGNNLSGTLPASIRDLDYLRTLLLPLNNLTGPLPNVFHEMASLKEMHLDKNQLTGSIPQSIGYSTTLEVIQLSGNALTGNIPSYLNNLTSLRHLILNGNQLTGLIPNSIGLLGELRNLYLYDNDLSGSIPTSIGNLSKLEFLHLQHNRIGGEIPLTVGNLLQLKSFSVHDNNIGGPVPTGIGNLANLELFFAYNNKLTGQLPTTLGNLKKVTNFLLLSNQLTGPIPTQVGSMTNLQYLNLTENKISGTIPSQLGNLTKMHTLRLDYNELTGQIPATLCSIPTLVLFYAQMNKLTGDVPVCLLTKLPNLFRISHNYYSFTDLGSKTQYWPQPNYYSPQRSDPALTTYSVSGTGSITLATTVGKNMGSPSNYQWYKNGNALTGASPANESITVNCPASGGGGFNCSGNYIGDVTNPGYPTIVILAVGGEIEGIDEDDEDDLDITICTLNELDSEVSPLIASVGYRFDWEEAVECCLEESFGISTAILETVAEQPENRREELYWVSVSTACLEDASEPLTKLVTDKGFHYTHLVL